MYSNTLPLPALVKTNQQSLQVGTSKLPSGVQTIVANTALPRSTVSSSLKVASTSKQSMLQSAQGELPNGNSQGKNLERTIVLNGSPKSKEQIESISKVVHKSILNSIPNIHVKYAAYKAAEFIKTHRADLFPRKYIISTQSFPKVGTIWNLPEGIDSEHERLSQHVYNHYLNDQIDFLVRTLPDSDPTFLEEEVKRLEGDQEKVRKLVSDIFEGNRTIPSRADYNKRKEYNKLANKFFTVEEFVELYDDPVKYFMEDSRITDAEYCEQAVNQLKIDFRQISVVIIKDLFAKRKYHYTPTYVSLRTNPFQTMKTKRPLTGLMRIKTEDLFLIQEVAFVRLLPELQTYLENKKKMRADALAHCRTHGTLLTCPICCEDELIELDFVYCPVGHGVCGNCVCRQTEEFIGQMKNHIPCLAPDCSYEYSMNSLKEALKRPSFYRLEKRRQAEEILAAGIEGLESCPFCEYCEVPRVNDSSFNCKNPECSKRSCRQCREVDHMPLRCEEFAVKKRLNNYVEDKMTEALLRTCPACKQKFIKSEGCNKMVCVCGAMMCYICRKQIKDYNHFHNNNVPNQVIPGTLEKCPLFSDTQKMHEEEIAISAKKARLELALSNPNIRVDLVLSKK